MHQTPLKSIKRLIFGPLETPINYDNYPANCLGKNKRPDSNQAFIARMGRIMGLEPTNDRFTAGCVNHFTISAI